MSEAALGDAGSLADVALSVSAGGTLLGVCLALNMAWLVRSVALLGAALVLSGRAAADSLRWLVLRDRSATDSLADTGVLAVMGSLSWLILRGLCDSGSLGVGWLVSNLGRSKSVSLGLALVLRSLAWLVLGGLRSANSLALNVK